MLKKIALITLAAGSLALVGCNTVEGIGKDIKSAGKRVEKESK